MAAVVCLHVPCQQLSAGVMGTGAALLPPFLLLISCQLPEVSPCPLDVNGSWPRKTHSFPMGFVVSQQHATLSTLSH